MESNTNVKFLLGALITFVLISSVFLPRKDATAYDDSYEYTSYYPSYGSYTETYDYSYSDYSTYYPEYYGYDSYYSDSYYSGGYSNYGTYGNTYRETNPIYFERDGEYYERGVNNYNQNDRYSNKYNDDYHSYDYDNYDHDYYNDRTYQRDLYFERPAYYFERR